MNLGLSNWCRRGERGERHRISTDVYADAMLFQVCAIPDNDRGPRYAEAVLNSLHETNDQRHCEMDPKSWTVG